MNVLESIAEPLAFLSASFAGCFIAGVNLMQYLGARKWLNSHGVNPSFYEDRIKNRKEDSSRESVQYYLGYFGRAIAYKQHLKNMKSLE